MKKNHDEASDWDSTAADDPVVTAAPVIAAARRVSTADTGSDWDSCGEEVGSLRAGGSHLVVHSTPRIGHDQPGLSGFHDEPAGRGQLEETQSDWDTTTGVTPASNIPAQSAELADTIQLEVRVCH